LVLSLIKLVCRITNLGWFDDAAHRDLPDDVTKFLQATVDHCILGLKILNQLVDELNIQTTGRTLTQHRKTSVSFRDVSLLKVFQLGLTTLNQLQTGAIGKFLRFWLGKNVLAVTNLRPLSIFNTIF
jgi:exportin-7